MKKTKKDKGLTINQKVILIKNCQACGSKNLFQFLNFGPMPIPNIYKTEKEIRTGGQITFQLDASLCTDCGLVQLGEIVPSELLFASEYAYKTPEAMRLNFSQSVKETISLARAKKGDKVLEIGSNIGICLKEYQKKGLVILGVDPAEIYAQKANE